jgi:hypothetical protein
VGFFDISGDVIKQAEAAANFTLVRPPDAKVDKAGGAAWTEHGRIIGTSSETVEVDMEGRKAEVLILHVQMEIDKTVTGLNEGGKFRHNMRINRIALQNGAGAVKGSPMKKQHTMSQMSLHKLKAILKACQIQPDTDDGGYSQSLLAECFPPADSLSGVPSPLLDCAFTFELKESKSESTKEPGRWFTNYEIATVFNQ